MIKKDIFFAFASITLLLLILASCRSARYLNEDQALVTKVSIEGVTPALKESAAAYVSTEVRPNSRLNLSIYNVFNTKDGAYKRDGIRNVGEPPHILDSSLVDLSAKQINRFLQTKGYFNATVVPQALVKKKKAAVQFDVELGQPFLYGSITQQVADPAIEKVYRTEVLPFAKAKPGKQFDSADLLDEREAMYNKLKEYGYYEYLRQYMRVGIDTNKVSKQADLQLSIQDPTDSTKHVVYYVDSVFATVRLPYGQSGNGKPKSYRDTTLSIQYHDETGRFRLRPLAQYMYVRSGMRYNMKKENQAYDRLYETNGFRNIKINYQKVDSNRRHGRYELRP